MGQNVEDDLGEFEIRFYVNGQPYKCGRNNIWSTVVGGDYNDGRFGRKTILVSGKYYTYVTYDGEYLRLGTTIVQYNDTVQENAYYTT